ncbi:MAG: hypothetical protein H0T73_21565 [Ardenticatenales bacterium]|nr:hypothetical protein [Ardenticatenales bacterium]
MPSIHVGVALSDANRADLPTGLCIPENLTTYAESFREALGVETPFFELQPNDHFVQPARYPDQFRLNRDNRWLNAVEFNQGVQSFIDSRAHRLGVHQPLLGDMLSSNFFGKYSALEEARRAMDFASGIGAEYFVMHLAYVDKWDWERSDQIDKGLKFFKDIATYYRSYGYHFVPCIEVLEYPKFPATGGELCYIINACQKVLHETRIALNVSHLWRARNLMLATGHWEDAKISFVQHLEYTLAQCWEQIHVFQLGGCWESETHSVPGLHPQQNPYDHPMKLRESTGVYQESGEIDLNRTLDLLLEYTIDKGRDLNLVLEIHDRDSGQVNEAARLIRDDLRARVEERSQRGPYTLGNES